MKKSLLLLFIPLCQWLMAGDALDYRQHIATDRFLLIFEAAVSDEQKADILYRSGLVTSFTHLPAPSLTICFTEHAVEAQTYFATTPGVAFVSFFITDGKHYAGVLDHFFVKLKSENFKPLLAEKLKQMHLGEAKADAYIPNLFKVRNVPVSGIGERTEATNTPDVCAELLSEGWVEYASPDYLLNPLVCSNDPLFTRQWNIHNTGSVLQGNGTPDADMDVDSAWTITTGDPNIKVSIIDSGVDTLHEDLVVNMLPGHDALGDSTDGFPTPVFKEDGHGTCCAGIVAAEMDNQKGIAGVAPTCKIIPVRAFYYRELSPGSGPIPISTAAAFADAIGWSWNVANADILSNSWGLPPAFISILPGGTQPVEDAIQQAYLNGRGGKGLAMFFSSGNENGSAGPIWPGSLANTIAVNATSMCDERKNPNDCSPETWGGDYGPGLDFSAPGVRIPATDIMGNDGFTVVSYYNSFNGTSAACPNAAAVGALVLSLHPGLGPEDVRHIIAQSCDKVGGYAYDSVFFSGTWCNELGYGRVNAYQALQYAQNYSSVNDKERQTFFRIFPNPSADNVQVEYTGEQEAVLRISDVTGKEVFQSTLQRGVRHVNVSWLSNGIYHVQVESGGKTETGKIAVMR